MAYCRQCGTPVDDNQEYCNKCGLNQGVTVKNKKNEVDPKIAVVIILIVIAIAAFVVIKANDNAKDEMRREASRYERQARANANYYRYYY